MRVALASQGVGLIADLGRQVSRAASRRRRLRRAAAPQDLPPPAASRADRARRPRRARRRARRRRRDPRRRLRAVHGDALRRPAARHRREDPGLARRAALRRRASSPSAIYFVGFWAFEGQTPGMRFIGIQLEHEGSPGDRRQTGLPAPLGDRPRDPAVRPRPRPDPVPRQPHAAFTTASRRHGHGQARQPRPRALVAESRRRASPAEPSGARRYPSWAMSEATPNTPRRVLLAAPARLLRGRRPSRADGRARARPARSARLRPQGDRPQQARGRAAQRARGDLRRGGDRGPRGRARRLQRPRRLAGGPRERGEAAAADDRRDLPARDQGPRRGPQVRRGGLHDRA